MITLFQGTLKIHEEAENNDRKRMHVHGIRTGFVAEKITLFQGALMLHEEVKDEYRKRKSHPAGDAEPIDAVDDQEDADDAYEHLIDGAGVEAQDADVAPPMGVGAGPKTRQASNKRTCSREGRRRYLNFDGKLLQDENSLSILEVSRSIVKLTKHILKIMKDSTGERRQRLRKDNIRLYNEREEMETRLLKLILATGMTDRMEVNNKFRTLIRKELGSSRSKSNRRIPVLEGYTREEDSE